MKVPPSPPLILASTSPYRKRLLERLGIPFSCTSPGTDETPRSGESSEDLACRLADAKALVVSRSSADALVIGSDQVAALGSVLLGKPGNIPAAREQLRRCSGRSVNFYTAVSFAREGTLEARRCVRTTVRFRSLSDGQIADYIEREQPLDCAGSFRWEGLGICLFTALESTDPTALEGLPLIATCDVLTDMNIYPLNNN